MQVEYKDGLKGEPIMADSVEELLPKIKEALKDPDVKCVRVYNNGNKVQAEEDRKTPAEQVKELLEQKRGDMYKATLKIPKKRK